jgi:hypothetical protein
MDFQLNDDQLAIVDAVDRIAQQFDHVPSDFHGFVLTDEALDTELTENQFFDIAHIPELGALTAAMAVERLARCPCAVEAALSMLVLPQLGGEWERPLAVVENGKPGRFVHDAKTLILIDGDSVALARNEEGLTEAVDSLYAYPMGRVVGEPVKTELAADDAAAVIAQLRVASAAEMAGLLKAAVDATVEHLSVRKQFGRQLGTFQALRHRMAECAVLVGGVRWLALKAAYSGQPGDAALALSHAQESGTRVAYDMHQMMGAMGMTLEMSLHLWTYRIKALLSDFGGRGAQAQAVGELCFD